MRIMLFTFLGIVLAFIVIVLLIYLFIRRLLDQNGFRGRSLSNLYQESKRQAMLDKSRIKDVSGLTTVLLPTIQNFFNDFNKDEMFLWVETNLRNIFDAIETRKESKLDTNELSLIKDKLVLQIRNLNKDDITKTYHDIVFHKHAIKDFRKDDGKAIITISTSLEYYYEEKRGEEVIVKSDYKKQTRYQTEFIYVFDVNKTEYDIKALGLNCPNCGSPIRGYLQKECDYCKCGIDIRALDFKKCWKIINFTEDY